MKVRIPCWGKRWSTDDTLTQNERSRKSYALKCKSGRLQNPQPKPETPQTTDYSLNRPFSQANLAIKLQQKCMLSQTGVLLARWRPMLQVWPGGWRSLLGVSQDKGYYFGGSQTTISQPSHSQAKPGIGGVLQRPPGDSFSESL